jgi:hypothetical protein
MAEAHERIEAERPGAALHRVNRAKHRVDRLGVRRSLLHGHQAFLELREKLVALDEEGRPDGVHRIHRCRPF